MAYCAYCKATVLNRHAKCPNCGSTVFLTDDEPVARAPEPQPEYRPIYVEKPVYHTVYVETPVRVARSSKSWLAALLLCLFFGGAGFHRFYVGKIGTGVAIILTIGGFFGIWPLIDFIMILVGSFKDKEERYLANW